MDAPTISARGGRYAFAALILSNVFLALGGYGLQIVGERPIPLGDA